MRLLRIRYHRAGWVVQYRDSSPGEAWARVPGLSFQTRDEARAAVLGYQKAFFQEVILVSA